jgi:hypothetical protein
MSELDAPDLGAVMEVGAWLRAAYLRRKSKDWPAFTTAMRSPVLSRLILQEAQHPTAQATIRRPEVVRPDPPPAEVSSTVTKPGNVTVTKRAGVVGPTEALPLDFRSLAAGEKPDTGD